MSQLIREKTYTLFSRPLSMLESPRLHLQWTDRRSEAAIAIREPNTLTDLGLARFAIPRRRWWPKFPDLEVSEGEDQSLVFRLRHSWFLSPFWVVEDAEGNCISKLKVSRRRALEFDRSTSSIAPLLPERRNGRLVEGPQIPEVLDAGRASFRCAGKILTANERPLARLEWAATHTMLQFESQLEGDPFTRMVVLAVALLWRRS